MANKVFQNRMERIIRIRVPEEHYRFLVESGGVTKCIREFLRVAASCPRNNQERTDSE